jgi:hypothetical protein
MTTTTLAPPTAEIDFGDIDAEWLALSEATDPTELPEWLLDDEPAETDLPVKASTGRHAARYCPWTDVEVPPRTGEHPAVEAAATTAMLDLPVTFIKSPTAKHAHDGTALAMIDHAANVLKHSLSMRSVPRGRLRDLLHQLEAMR